MKGSEGFVPLAVVVWIAIGSLLAGAAISYLVFGKSIVASVGLGLILGIIIAPSLMTIVYKWLSRYEKK